MTPSSWRVAQPIRSESLQPVLSAHQVVMEHEQREQLSSGVMAAEEGTEDWRVARLRMMLALFVHWMQDWRGGDCVVACWRLVQCWVPLAA